MRGRTTKTKLALAARGGSLALALAGCGDIAGFLPPVPGGPEGALTGTVTYSGPAPCTESGHVVGAAVLLAFDVNLLPPPEGLGTSAASLAVVTGERLFAGAHGQIFFDPSGKRSCPDPSAPPITVSADWTLAPLPAGTYELRGFYDHDGNFDPAFKISNLPTKGDVGGGAIDNPAEVLAGKAARYRKISLGTRQGDGSLVIPSTGSRVDGVAVTLGLTLPLDRPIFYSKTPLDETSVKNTDGAAVMMPSDFQLELFSASPATEKSFIRLDLGAGVPLAEAGAAAKSPFGFPAAEPFVFTRQDVNGDGVLDAKDHVPDSALVPSLFPLAIFSKLVAGSPLTSQGAPLVVLQGITIYKSLLATVSSAPTLSDPLPDVLVALRPAVLCLDPGNPKKHGVLLSARKTDKKGNVVIADQPGVEAALGAQFGRPIDIQFGCLPQGSYAMNLIYGTGQAWTVPNEAGVCQAGEAPNGSGVCGTRPRLASQGVRLTIGPPSDPAYCKANPTPAACLPY